MNIKKIAVILSVLMLFSSVSYAAPMSLGTVDISVKAENNIKAPSLTAFEEVQMKEEKIGYAKTYYETYYAMNNRNTNMTLAVNAINGTVLMPYEFFSYNKAVGPRTYERGFRVATIFVGNEKDEGLGGGICQVSSTLYMAAKSAGMAVVERHQHTLPVTYCKPEDEATVAWGLLDLRLQNNFDVPVRIDAKIKGGILQVEIVKLSR